MAEINSIFNFLKDYNEISNPVITEIDMQKWSMKLSNLPQINEVWSIYRTMNFADSKILEIERPVLKPCPTPDDLIIDWLDKNWEKINIKEISYKETISRKLMFYQYSCNECGWIYNPRVGDSSGNIPSYIDFKNISEDWECPKCSTEKKNFKRDQEVDCYKEEGFHEDENRQALYNKWIVERVNWRTVEIPKAQGLILYNNLFKLYSDMKKESESVELILGDGHIHWSTDLRVLDHPVLLQRVQLEFDSEKPSFVIKCDELKTELYTPMLRIIPTINQSMLSDIILDIETNTNHIADKSNTGGFFQRLINVVDEKGKCVEVFESDYSGPMIMSQPVLFLRKRTLGFSMFIQKIIEDIENKQDITLPNFFENMIGNHKNNIEVDVIRENWNQSGIDQDILLTLPANNEQLKIIKYLNTYGAVLVQGPPGTGKTHTIANLIGHLLSQGSSVLVTSQREEALTVLKEKVYKDLYNKDINLQSLCISLLSSSSQKKEMDDVLNEIAIKGTTLDLNETNKKIERLESERKELIFKSKTKSQELLQIRSLEYKDIVFANSTIAPIDAAKFINIGQGKFDYIPGSTYDDTTGLPLSTENISTLYYSNQQISLEENELLSQELPALESLWGTDHFKNKADSYIKYNEEIKGWNPKLVLKNNIEENVLLEFLETASSIIDSFTNMEAFQLAIIDKTLKDSIYKTLWISTFEEFDILLENYEKYRKIYFENDYSIPDKVITAESMAIINEIISSGKKTPVTLLTAVTKPKWKKFRYEITNSGKIIENRADFENVKIIIQYEIQRAKILNKVNKLLAEVSNNDYLTVDGFEEKAKQYRKKILSSLNWHKNIWTKFTNNLQECCLDRKKLEELSDLDIERPTESIINLLNNSLYPDLKKRHFFELLGNIKNEWIQFSNYLNEYKSFGKPFDELFSASIEKDINTYEKSFAILSDILAKKEIYMQRCQLIKQLKIVAPDWSEAIKTRVGIHGGFMLPDNIESAWKWRQLSNQVARIDSYDANTIQKELRKINEQLMQNARKLAYEKAWYEKIKNKTAQQTQAIEGWRQTIKQIGKATSTKTAPALLNKARELMPLCQTAIPVWIMPLNRVAENFDVQKNKFDVVIIDEASQAGILALSALYLGKKVIIVGDDEQVSPDTVGLKTDEISALIEQHLKGIPNNHLFNGKTSVYDMAKASGFKSLMLTEHFRCVPEIIEFSNQLSYNGKIKPLRDASSVKVKPSVIELRIPNAYKSANKVNEIEAEHIASMICACNEEDNYKDKTIGVISLLGHEQASEIDKLLRVNLEPKEYVKRKIQCGTPSQFQGDERDIIFLSVVEGPSEKGGPVRLLSEDGNNDINRKKYNVAASRARDQMWVVHSLNPEVDLKPDDIRLKLINHAINPTIDRNQEKYKKAESDFEKQVMSSLLNQGYKIIPQWTVGAYRIDMVIEGEDIRIALECDGERWHTQDDLPNDLKRQAILERLGWKFIRIRGSAFYRNPEETMKWVFDELDSYEIRPNYVSDQEVYENEAKSNNEIIERLKRRAEEIRREWREEIILTDFDETREEDEILNTTSIDVLIKETEGIEDQVEIPLINIQESVIKKEVNNKFEVNNLNKLNIASKKLKSEQLSFDLPELDKTGRQITFGNIEKKKFK